MSAGLLLDNAMAAPDVQIDIDAMPDTPVPASLQRVFAELLDKARKFS